MDLTQTYVRILEDIRKKDPQQRNIAIACFRWLLSATREPRWTELELVLPLAMSTPAKSLEQCRDGPTINRVASACGNLVHIPKQSNNTVWNGDERITFIHASVSQFFSMSLSSLEHIGDPWSILFDKQTMHCKNALDCLTYIDLLIEELCPFDNIQDIDTVFKYDPFAYYAIHNFDKHLVASGEASNPHSASLASLKQMLARDEKYLGILLQLRVLLKPDIEQGFNEDSRTVSLEAPALIDCFIWTTRLHEVLSTPPWRKSPIETLLVLAQGGILESMYNFVRTGLFDFASKDYIMVEAGYHAMIYGSACNNTSIVELLLRKGVSPHTAPTRNSTLSLEWYDHETPLSLAIESGNNSMVELLLPSERLHLNIPVNHRGQLQYPLQMAMSYGKQYGDMYLFDLLLYYGANERVLERSDAVGGAELRSGLENRMCAHTHRKVDAIHDPCR